MEVIYVIVAGILGTAAMSLVMWFITRSGIANADMIRAIGCLFTKEYERSQNVGLVVHFLVGVTIAFIYAALISLFSPQSSIGYLGVGTMIGIFHGVSFGFLLVVVVAEHHPIERFREAGVEVALAHFAGHVVYGLVVGAVAGLFTIRIVF